MIAFHWSPCERRASIWHHGLLVPSKHPELVTPTVRPRGTRASHISLATTPDIAWQLSGEFLLLRATATPPTWDLWQVRIPRRRCGPHLPGSSELAARVDIPPSRLKLMAVRELIGG